VYVRGFRVIFILKEISRNGIEEKYMNEKWIAGEDTATGKGLEIYLHWFLKHLGWMWSATEGPGGSLRTWEEDEIDVAQGFQKLWIVLGSFFVETTSSYDNSFTYSFVINSKIYRDV